MKPKSRTSDIGRIQIQPITNVQIENYLIEKKKFIGKGQYGIVYSCVDQNNKLEELCAKQIPKNEVDPILVKREIEILKLLKPLQDENIHLVQLFDVIEDKEKSYIYIIMEKCNEGDLKGQMEKKTKSNQWFTISEAKDIIKQIVFGYQALFKKKVIHRDIKPANILIKDGIYKIGDLGMGRILEDMGVAQNITKVGTPAYAAPQLFLEPLFSSKADVYSLGVIFYQLIYNELPVKAVLQAELIENLRNLKDNPIKCKDISATQEKVPNQIQKLIESMLKFEEVERASWMDLFASEVFSLNIAKQKQNNPRKLTLDTVTSNQYQIYYRVDEINIETKQDKLLHIVRILINNSDLAAKCYKLFQEQKFNINRIKFDNQTISAIQVYISGYRYRTIQNALGLLINQPATIIQDFKQRFTQNDLQEFGQFQQNENRQKLKEYIQLILNQSVLQFREDECTFVSNIRKINNSDYKTLQQLLQEEDNPDFLPYIKGFRKIYTTQLSYLQWNKNDQKNIELIKYFEKLSSLQQIVNIEQFYQIKPSDILQKSIKLQ